MNRATSNLFSWALVAGVPGGLLAFGVNSSDASVWIVNLNAIGGVLLALAVVLAIAATIALVGPLDRSK